MSPNSTTTTTTIIHDINLLANYLAHPQPLSSQTSCLVLCVSALLNQPETVFTTLQTNPQWTSTLVLCGGIGHSTSHLYAAVAAHPRYRHLSAEIAGKPEAQVLSTILTRCFHLGKTIQILIEDESTNCGANASNTLALLQAHQVAPPTSVVIVQDPTMARRTVASFQKVFGPRTEIISWPVFVPRVRRACVVGGEGQDQMQMEYDIPVILSSDHTRLWSLPRFLGLVMGEIPRLRDDAQGYGPRGKGFIGHVDIPDEVEAAWRRLQGIEMQR
ncbi:hypothetical protein FE257_011479 [Aspergillus nanangensis]|uniref:DUF218 domain-containing protein n=1 Tax=Aspergillus nanangensis TaxID=2582783 RepID=A0AAD4CHJ4_ASPNN|nr:hypothetical protein FE257_011479 [Aspergillus nanangensis]